MAVATKFQKWQVVSGCHYQNRTSYKKGSTFITDADMSKFNTLPHAPKYRLIGEATEAEILQFQANKGFTGDSTPTHVDDSSEEVVEDSLGALTVPELKALAKDESIDISGLHTKTDILARVREARAE